METCTKVQCKQVSTHAIINITQQKKRKEKGNNPKLTENSTDNTIFHRERKKDRSQEVACKRLDGGIGTDFRLLRLPQ